MKYNVGDRVKVIFDCEHFGKVGTITQKLGDNVLGTVYIDNGLLGSWVQESSLELQIDNQPLLEELFIDE